MVHNTEPSPRKHRLMLTSMNLWYMCLAPTLAANQIFKAVKLFIMISLENYFFFCLSFHVSYSPLKTESDGVQLIFCWDTRGKFWDREKKKQQNFYGTEFHNKSGWAWIFPVLLCTTKLFYWTRYVQTNSQMEPKGIWQELILFE